MFGGAATRLDRVCIAFDRDDHVLECGHVNRRLEPEKDCKLITHCLEARRNRYQQQGFSRAEVSRKSLEKSVQLYWELREANGELK